jgi:hypothetical protein
LAQLDILERAVTKSTQLPEMRLEVIAALDSLSDPARQERWGQVEEGVSYYDDLTLNVHTLYDDCMVLPDPQGAVPAILHPDEIPAFHDLERVLGPMVRDLGDSPDMDYLADSRWPIVMQAARKALSLMEACDDEEST